MSPFTTPILDDFNRVENPLSQSGAWYTGAGLYGSGSQLQADGSRALGQAAYSGQYRAVPIALPFEAYVTLVTPADWTAIVWSDTTSAAQNGYTVILATGGWQIQLFTAGAGNGVASGSVTWAAGDGLGITVDTNRLITAHKRTAGVWAALGSYTDSSLAFVSGYLGLYADSASVRFDDFGGGFTGAGGQILLPDADLATTGWATAPLFSKVNDESDATVITSTI